MGVREFDESEVGVTWVMDEPMARASHALVDDGKVWLIDPVDDPEAIEKVSGLGEVVAVFQLLDRHNRDSQAIANRLGAQFVMLPDELRGTPFESIEVVDNRLWKERALWWQAKQTLIVAEAIGTSKMFRPLTAGAGIHIGLRMRPPKKALGTYVPQHLLVGHGSSIHGPQATTALQEAMDHSRRGLPKALVSIPRAFS